MLLKHISSRKGLLAFGDVVLIICAYFLSHLIRFGVFSFNPLESGREWVAIAAICVIYVFVFYVFDLYDTSNGFVNERYAFRFLAGTAVWAVLSIVALFSLHALSDRRGIFGITVVLAALFAYGWRLLFGVWFSPYRLKQKKLLIVGAGTAGTALYGVVSRNRGYDVVGFVDDDPGGHDPTNAARILGGYEELDGIVAASEADEIALAVSHEKHLRRSDLLQVALRYKARGTEVRPMATLYEELTGKIPVRHVSDMWFINTTIAGMKRNAYNKKIKRILDILFSFLGLIFWGLPLLLFVPLLIKAESRGPVFYRQKRVGLDGSLFELLKFRSMADNAEKDGPVWASHADPRVTRVGRIIRKLRIDEIPQMWNVLKGDMSFIGPRPERPEFVEMLEGKIPYYALRHSVKPGITGWAQVNYPYGASEEDALEKLEYDLFYIKNLSAFMDFYILFRTIRVILFRSGSR